MMKLFVLFVCLGVAYVSGQNTTTPTTQPLATTAVPTKSLNPSSTAPKPASSSTTATKSTSSSTTATKSSSTINPSSSTVTPTSSPTPKPTPKPTATKSSSTINPSSSTVTPTSSPTPTPTPKPTPPPSHGNFSLKDNKTYCLLAEFAVTFTVHYVATVFKINSTNTTTTKNETTIIFLNRTNSHDVDITGKCGLESSKAELSVSWPKKDKLYTMTMEFDKKTKALGVSKKMTSWTVRKISLLVILKGNQDFPNATVNNFTSSYVNGSTVPNGDLGGYYMCDDVTDITLKADKKDYSVGADFKDLKVEPFVNKTRGDDFGKNVNDCYKDNPTTKPTEAPNNDIVPIAVGCALAGLVLIVLIAYVIGRRKSHRGYEKV